MKVNTKKEVKKFEEAILVLLKEVKDIPDISYRTGYHQGVYDLQEEVRKLLLKIEQIKI